MKESYSYAYLGTEHVLLDAQRDVLPKVPLSLVLVGIHAFAVLPVMPE